MGTKLTFKTLLHVGVLGGGGSTTVSCASYWYGQAFSASIDAIG